MLQPKSRSGSLPSFAIACGLSGVSAGVSGMACVAVSLAVLLAPALWNGYAIIFYDTGGYAEAALHLKLVPGRSLFYGLFLWLSSLGWWSFWGPVLIQSLTTLWLLHLLLRCHALPSGPQALLIAVAALAGLTGLSWYTSQLMPDILLPLVVLALWLLGLHWPRLRPGERVGLFAVTFLGMVSHMSCLALALGLTVVIATIRSLNGRWRLPPAFPLPPLAAVLATLVLMPTIHLALTGHGGYTPGGPIFLFGRLVQDGLIKRWLAEHCPAPGIELCGLQERLPATADEFLWTGQSPFQNLGGWQGGAEPEIKYLTLAAIRAYPGMTLWTTLRSTAEQTVKVATGDALDEGHYDTRGFILKYLRDIGPSFMAARQQREDISSGLFDRLNTVHVPVGLFAFFSLLPLAFWLLRMGRPDLAALAFFVLIALLGNAFICGALSNPHDRYQNRLIWLAPLVVGMAVAAYWGNRQVEVPSDRSR